jgi:hypothetical protein
VSCQAVQGNDFRVQGFRLNTAYNRSTHVSELTLPEIFTTFEQFTLLVSQLISPFSSLIFRFDYSKPLGDFHSLAFMVSSLYVLLNFVAYIEVRPLFTASPESATIIWKISTLTVGSLDLAGVT